MRVTLKTTGPTEAVVILNMGGNRRVSLPVQLIDGASAGVWVDGRLEQLVPAAAALQLVTASEQSAVKTLRAA